MSNRQLTTVKMHLIKQIILIAIIFQFFIKVTCIEVILKDWPPRKSRNISIYLSTKLPDLPQDFCKYPTKLLIIVFSKVENIQARNVIRTTWGNKTVLSNYNISIYFLLGKHNNLTKEEHSIYNDLIFEDFNDSYSNLTLKSVAMLKIVSHQNQCKFLLKADDDVYVIIKNLLPLVRNIKNAIVGRLVKKDIRNVNNKSHWYAPSYMYRKRHYPDFVAGPAYLMNQLVATKLYKVALTLPLFHLEDVFITGICAREAQIQRLHVQGFTNYKLPRSKCAVFRIATLHDFNPEKMITLPKLLRFYMNKCERYKRRKL